MARRTKEELEDTLRAAKDGREAMEASYDRDETEAKALLRFYELEPKLNRLEQLEIENRQLMAHNTQLQADATKAQVAYQKLTDEWNWLAAHHSIPKHDSRGAVAEVEFATRLVTGLLRLAGPGKAE